MKLDIEIYKMSRIMSISLLERMPIRDLLVPEKAKENLQSVTQLSLIFFYYCPLNIVSSIPTH